MKKVLDTIFSQWRFHRAHVTYEGAAVDDDPLSGAISELADVQSIRLVFLSQA